MKIYKNFNISSKFKNKIAIKSTERNYSYNELFNTAKKISFFIEKKEILNDRHNNTKSG